MPSKSQQQQKFMGMVYATKKGKIKPPSPAVAKAAKSMSEDTAKDFASAKRKRLPVRSNKKLGRVQKSRKSH